MDFQILLCNFFLGTDSYFFNNEISKKFLNKKKIDKIILDHCSKGFLIKFVHSNYMR